MDSVEFDKRVMLVKQLCDVYQAGNIDRAVLVAGLELAASDMDVEEEQALKPKATELVFDVGKRRIFGSGVDHQVEQDIAFFREVNEAAAAAEKAVRLKEIDQKIDDEIAAILQSVMVSQANEEAQRSGVIPTPCKCGVKIKVIPSCENCVHDRSVRPEFRQFAVNSCALDTEARVLGDAGSNEGFDAVSDCVLNDHKFWNHDGSN